MWPKKNEVAIKNYMMAKIWPNLPKKRQKSGRRNFHRSVIFLWSFDAALLFFWLYFRWLWIWEKMFISIELRETCMSGNGQRSYCHMYNYISADSSKVRPLSFSIVQFLSTVNTLLIRYNVENQTCKKFPRPKQVSSVNINSRNFWQIYYASVLVISDYESWHCTTVQPFKSH